MSRVDYSKWDHIELSDDEDVEVHPNVDKKSFIRWRQQQIHEERAQRKHGIEQYAKQLEWLDKYLAILDHFPDPSKDVIDKAHKLLAEFQNVPDNLQFTKVHNSPQAFDKFRQHVRKHRETIVKERERLVQEDKMKVGMEIYASLGLSQRCRINKDSPSTAAAAVPPAKSTPSSSSKSASSASKKTTEVVEVLNPLAANKAKAQHAKEAAKAQRGPEDKYITTDEALVFANWSTTDYKGMYAYLRDHAWLVASSVSDEILAAAFQAEMDGRHAKTKQYVHQAQVIQFCVNLGANGAPMFFSKITDPSHQATQLFRADIDRTLAHIVKRSQVLAAKAKGELESSINLDPVGNKMEVFRSLPADLQQALVAEDMAKVGEALGKVKSDREREALRQKMMDSGILVNPNAPHGPAPKLEDIVDDEGKVVTGEERIELFKQLPREFGKALLDGDLDKAQEVLQAMPEDEQEAALQICKKGGFLEFEEADEDEYEAEHGQPEDSGVEQESS
ncbi:hypothetical protein BCR44DRAFT_1427826 [Catenaria anguillulae PL171]|uniref:Hsp90 chaperone protein kinase-targeting subunit n=1 Tax=Catenaria anguillulae PL171 TaxID=765915 RepID=A0A1Y2HW19_9FUNG|nr:hypothetical protein BCR44DRAFT_1427826 [Catenaria anguillulae PL171]